MSHMFHYKGIERDIGLWSYMLPKEKMIVQLAQGLIS